MAGASSPLFASGVRRDHFSLRNADGLFLRQKNGYMFTNKEGGELRHSSDELLSHFPSYLSVSQTLGFIALKICYSKNYSSFFLSVH